MRHTRQVFVVMVVVAGLLGTAQASYTYSGALSYTGGGIIGIPGNPWLTEGTTLSWSVEAGDDGIFTYIYRLQVPDDSKEISHMTFEVSDTFGPDNILEVLEGSIADDQPDTYPKGGADVGMPGSLFGIKFEGGGDDSTGFDWTASFTSDRAPVWGDFYAVDGKKPGEETAIWNAGFTNPDFDPQVGPSNGSQDNHILVPDTTTFVPVPGAVLLTGIGSLLVGCLRRRRRLS